MFKTIKKDTTAEIVEKKSKFIANLFYVETVEEAEEKVKEIKKKYFDARHNCFAYSVYTKDRIVNRFSDDGEPSGTAGGPMLNLLNGNNITNAVVIVTRYFGGILLGTGGLVRAYTDASKAAIDENEIVFKENGLECMFEVSYSDIEKLKYYLKQNDILETGGEYLENAFIKCDIIEPKLNKLLQENEEMKLNFKIISHKILREKYIIVEGK